jgi:hypothetical protein
MKIGVVVDGVSEYQSLGLIFPQLRDRSGHTFFKVVKADIQPKAPPGTIARAAKDSLTQLEARGADLVVILFDREDREICPPTFASEVWTVLRRWAACEVAVVVKNSTYENWLIADLGAFIHNPVRFKVHRAHRRQVQPNRADESDGLAVIKSIVQGDYDKVDVSKLVMGNARPSQIGMHSRSFRRFLRVVEDPDYRRQSKRPQT